MKLNISFLILVLFSNLYASSVLIDDPFRSSKPWFIKNNEERSVRRLLIKLASSPLGKELIKSANNKAKARGETLYDVIKAGRGSLTDTTLIRKFTVGNPEHIVYETQAKVYINKNLNQYDALLDLAHELTHFVYRKDFNPYVKNFSLDEFIQSTIEGEGGEVRAFITECKIAAQIFGGVRSGRSNCAAIQDGQEYSFSKAKEMFYQVGDHFHRFNKLLEIKKIRESFPELSDNKASFVSSAYGIPYPVAAFEEYVTVLNKVCQNDKKRLSYFKQVPERSPASKISAIEKSYESRCKNFTL